MPHLRPERLRELLKPEAEDWRLARRAIWVDAASRGQLRTTRRCNAIGVDQIRKRLEPISETWARRGEQLLLDGIHGVMLHRGNLLPARARPHQRRSLPVVGRIRVREDD